ncbi:uncharacterized protein LOC122320690 [Drosophila ficusphila]|uniref:uncharacterized protein LOC122320690 n=1 Tax=Drosophila ficusphila TaxID=30025 RepID=UPI001C8A196F|nr:uncharacterized protein LOC122320690 [Drosophila ficusphila]
MNKCRDAHHDAARPGRPFFGPFFPSIAPSSPNSPFGLAARACFQHVQAASRRFLFMRRAPSLARRARQMVLGRTTMESLGPSLTPSRFAPRRPAPLAGSLTRPAHIYFFSCVYIYFFVCVLLTGPPPALPAPVPKIYSRILFLNGHLFRLEDPGPPARHLDAVAGPLRPH